jgi:hypothetical protein
MKHDWVFLYEVTVLYQRREFMRKAKPTKPETEGPASRDTARKGLAEGAATDAARVVGQRESAPPPVAERYDPFLFEYFGLLEPIQKDPRSPS